MSGLGSGLVNLFKQWGKGIGKAADNVLLDAEARKAISDEVIKKFKPKIDLFNKAASRRADNIKDLGDKLNESKANWKKAKDQWQANYDSALAAAKNQRQTEIDNYNAQSKAYQDALDNANINRQNIVDQLYKQETTYTPTKTIYIDVNTGDRYLLHPATGEYKNITKIFQSASKEQQRQIARYMKGFDERLFDSSSKDVVNAFDKSAQNSYKGQNGIFDSYLNRVQAPQYTALRDADRQIAKANSDLNAWQNTSRPNTLDEKQFLKDYKKTNGSSPKEYSFNGQNYSNESDLDTAYQKALAFEQGIQKRAKGKASTYASDRDAEIAKRIQDAKDIKKAKLALGALGAGAGIGALYAGAKAMYGGDDTDNGDTPDNTDNTYTGKPDPDFNVEKEGQAILKDKQQIDTGFDPDKAEAEAVLAGAAYDKGVEDGSSVGSSDDLGNNIGASTRGHTMEDRLYELIKAMKDPSKADAIANYIYSRHGDDPEVQNLGWRGWLNKYYGDSLRYILGIDPSGYKGMHVSGGL